MYVKTIKAVLPVKWIGQNLVRHSLLAAILETAQKFFVRNLAVGSFDAAPVQKNIVSVRHYPSFISINSSAFYHKCKILNGYTTRCLFCDRNLSLFCCKIQLNDFQIYTKLLKQLDYSIHISSQGG